ncbi:MAG TPA: penicillin-binding protein 2, partial [Acidimicrobiia bacterium]|nr:penicillin-binding protein 2 [Acidimicrobiia bacterium]
PPIRLRLGALLVAMLVAFGAIGVRLFNLQARDQRELHSLALSQRVQTITLPAERGSIFDRNGADLAASVPQTTISADPRVIDDPIAYAAKLAPIVGADQAALEALLSKPKSQFAYVARKVDDDTVKQVKALDLPGLAYTPESKRFYPSGTLAGPVLGLVGTDNTGLGGLEYQYEHLLEGTPGEARLERDPQGNEIPGSSRLVTASQRGSDLVLTLDQAIQWNTEQVLTQQVTDTNAKGGTAIVMDVQTGDILAMVTVDGADDQHPEATRASNADNNAPVTNVFEPGSTNKVITMAGAIQEGIVTPDTSFDDIYMEKQVGDTVYKDEDAHGSVMSVAEILQHSSNVGTIKIAGLLGKERLDQYLRAFGFGRTTALDFPGEGEGILLPLQDFNDTSMGSIPIGNGISVTALQMLDVYATIANGGMARAPRLVGATVDADGTRHDEPLAAPHQVVSASTASQVNGMLQGVVEGGTGVKAKVPGYATAGKTGTARKPPYDTPPYRYVASFAGFAPANSPRLAAIVVIDEPSGGSYFAADVAAPVFKQVMQQALVYERIPPTESAQP